MKTLSGSGISSFKTAFRLNRDEAAARQSIRPPRMPAEDVTDSLAHVDPAVFFWIWYVRCMAVVCWQYMQEVQRSVTVATSNVKCTEFSALPINRVIASN